MGSTRQPMHRTMTILSSPSFLQSLLPPNWRAFEAHSTPNTTAISCTFILSPEGRRFSTVEAVNIYLTELIEKKERKQNQKVDNTDMYDNNINEETEKSAARRKKNMSDRNPLRNMLKRTLKRNYIKSKSLIKKLKKQRKRC